METKKRPSDDLSGSEALPSISLAYGQPITGRSDASPMDLDTAKAEIASTTVNSSPSTCETNKRLKMTVEPEIPGELLPLADVLDPSKESPQWAKQLDNKDEGPDGHDIADKPSHPAASPAVNTFEPESSKVEATVESKEIDNDPAQSNHEDITSQDLTRALNSAEPAPGANELSDSILAVAFLSEPLVATLEILEGEKSAPSWTEDTSTLTINAQLLPASSSNKPSSEPQDPVSSNPGVSDEIQQAVLAPLEATNPEGTSKKDDLEVHDSKSTPVEQDTEVPIGDQQPTKLESPVPEPSAPTGSLQSVSESHDVVMAPRPTDTVNIPPGKSESAFARVDQVSKQDRSPSIINEFNSEGKDINQSMPGSEPLGSPARTSSPQQRSSGASILASRISPVQSLPPLSSISATQPPSDVSQGPARPSRSSMSLAVLLGSTEDSEQEPDHGRRMSRSIFDQFEASTPTAPLKPSRLLTQTIPPLQPISPAQASSIVPQNFQSSGQVPVTSTSPRSGSGAASLHRMRDSTEMPSLQTQPGYSRPTAEINHTSGRGQELARVNPGKDYPGDEVMESGGVSGYGAPRHRLASPVRVRPLQDSANGASGGGPTNSKLPGLGSMTGLPPAPVHDPHGHSGSAFRNETAHPPLSTRPNSYSPSQHSVLAHPTSVNGHYPSTSHLTHSSGMPPTAPTQLANMPSAIVGHYPKLIIKNDPSLTMDGHPEFFLGYYRYEPTLLLPSMEGKENSLLEVRVASPYLTYDNVKVKKRELWGTDIYTDDSDVVAMLIHAGLFIPPITVHNSDQDSIQPDSQQHNFAAHPIKHICPSFDLAVTLRVMPKLVKYQGSIRNRIKSRTWSNGHDGQSLRIESIRKLCPGEALNKGRSQSKRRMKEYNQERRRVLSNIHDETTESLQNERAMRTATFEFTHQGDPCFKYSPELVMDRHDGLSRKWTSWRLKKEVLILENDEERYEISLQHQAGTDARRFDQYRFAVISPRTSLSSWSKATYPLNSADLTEVLYEDLDWQDFEWVERGVVVQPSQRSKQSITRGGSSSLMDGIVNAEKEKHAVPTRSSSRTVEPMAMDVEDGEAKNTGQDGTLKSKTGVEAGTLEVQQDGVFCVVSRLSWRPRSEQRSARPTGAGAMLSTENRTSKVAEKLLAIETQSQHGSKGSAPTPVPSTPGSKPLQEHVGPGDSSSGSGDKQNSVPTTNNITNGRQQDALEEGTAAVDTKNSASGPASGPAATPQLLAPTPVQSSEPLKPVSLTTIENAMDIDAIPTKTAFPVVLTTCGSGHQQELQEQEQEQGQEQPQENQQENQQQQRQQQQEQEQEQEQREQQQEMGHASLAEAKILAAPSESANIEREEGELEEGEIASD